VENVIACRIDISILTGVAFFAISHLFYVGIASIINVSHVQPTLLSSMDIANV
jgi:hypothetical protein